jgi:hypothetical protein
MTNTIFSLEAVDLSGAVDVWKIELHNAREHIKALSIELHDLQNGVQEAIQEIIANCDYLTLKECIRAHKSLYLSYHKGIGDGHESALKILRKHTIKKEKSMNIKETLVALYDIACEAQTYLADKDNELDLRRTLASVRKEDVDNALLGISQLLASLSNVSENMRRMYIRNFGAEADTEKKLVILWNDVAYGNSTSRIVTALTVEGAESLVSGLQMEIGKIKAGGRLAPEGNA